MNANIFQTSTPNSNICADIQVDVTFLHNTQLDQKKMKSKMSSKVFFAVGFFFLQVQLELIFYNNRVSTGSTAGSIKSL